MNKPKPVSELTIRYRRNKFNMLKRQKKPIPDDLNAILAMTFSDYDPVKRDFQHQLTERYLKAKFRLLRKQKIPTSDDFNAQLAAAFEYYDPIKRDFIARKPVKLKPLTEMTPMAVWYRFKKTKQAGDPIPNNLNEMMAQHFPTYDPQLRDFSPDRTRRNGKSRKNAVSDAKISIKNLNMSTRATEYYVTCADMEPAGRRKYKTICVNGKTLIQNALNPQIKTFMDNMLLAIHIESTDYQPAQWLLFDTMMRPVAKGPGSSDCIQNINVVNNNLYVHMDSRAIITISQQKLMRNIDNAKRFVLANAEHQI